MFHGRILEIGPRDAVFDRPQHPYTRRLLQATPRIVATGSGGFVDPGPPPTQEELPQVGVIDYPTASGVIDNNCTLSKCHGRDEEPLITVDAAFPAFLLNTFVEECGNVPLVTPGDPSKSALLLLVTRQCGELVMPDKCRTNPCLTDEDYATLLAWVQQGAPMQ